MPERTEISLYRLYSGKGWQIANLLLIDIKEGERVYVRFPISLVLQNTLKSEDHLIEIYDPQLNHIHMRCGCYRAHSQ